MASSGEQNRSSDSPTMSGYGDVEPSSSSPIDAETRSGFDPDSVRSSVFNASDGTVTPVRPPRHPRIGLLSDFRPFITWAQPFEGDGMMDDPEDVSEESDLEDDEVGIPKSFLGGWQSNSAAATQQGSADEEAEDEDDTEMADATQIADATPDDAAFSSDEDTSDEGDEAVDSDDEAPPGRSGNSLAFGSFSTRQPTESKRGPVSSLSQGPSAKRGRN